MNMNGQIDKKNVGEYIKQLGAYGIIITSFALGFAIAATFWSSSVSTLNSQLNITMEEKNKITQELMQVKSDYFIYRTSTQTKIDVLHETTTIPQTNEISNSNNQVEKGSIGRESSYSFFNGDVIISLIAIAFEGDPLRHKVLASVSSPNGQVVKIDKQDIGTVITYKTKNTYSITILSAETFSATFQVNKLDKQ